MRRATLILAVLAGFAAPASAAGEQGFDKELERPNIVVVMTDDMAASDLELMPNVQRLLADRGTTFTDAIDTFPLCCPARATFITGQYAHNHGAVGNFYPYGWYGMKNRANTLPSWLQDAGYRTALIGKWLNGYGARDAHGEVPAGFDIWRGLLDVSAYDYFNFVMNRDGELRIWGDKEFARNLVEFAIAEVTPGYETLAAVLGKLREVFGPPPYDYWGTAKPRDYSPDVTGRISNRILRTRLGSDRPIFLWWTPVAPHREDVATTLLNRPGPDPRPAPRYADESKGYRLPRPPSFNEPDISDKSSNLQSAAPRLSAAQIEQLQLDYEGRAGALLAVDDRVGRLVKTLRRSGELDDTLIMFLSDNGWLQGEHRIPGDKFLPYTESLRVPLIIRGPGVPAGRTIRSQVSNVDFAPTLLDFAHARPGRTMDGSSLRSTMRHPGQRRARAYGIEAPVALFPGDNIPVNAWDRPYRGVRTDRYTFVVWAETGERELYDRRHDPHELDSVAGDPEYAAIEARLARKMRTLADCKGRACRVAP